MFQSSVFQPRGWLARSSLVAAEPEVDRRVGTDRFAPRVAPVDAPMPGLDMDGRSVMEKYKTGVPR